MRVRVVAPTLFAYGHGTRVAQHSSGGLGGFELACDLFSELSSAGEHRLDVGGGRLLAANLGEISVVMHRQHQLVVRPELAQIETLGAVEVLVLETLRSELSGDGNARVVCGAAMCVASVCGVRS